MKTAVQVLLSSYNGEKYIREQLDSILAQEGVTVSLLVRDDGSTDGTPEILEEYRQAYPGLAVLRGENLGVIQSYFMLLAAAAPTPYTAFADQDDVWLPDKLARAVSLLEKEEPSVPLAYCSAVRPTDAALRPFRPAIRYRRIRAAFGNALVENICTGCTCVINGALRELINGAVRGTFCRPTAAGEKQRGNEAAANFPMWEKVQENKAAQEHDDFLPREKAKEDRALSLEDFPPSGKAQENRALSLEDFPLRLRTQEIIMHDFWIYLVAGAFGRVIYDAEPRILYRQHGDNSVGAASGVWENYRRRARNFRRNRGRLKRQAREFARLYGERLAEQDGEKAELLRDFAAGKRGLVLDRKLYRQRRSDDWIMRLFLLMGWL